MELKFEQTTFCKLIDLVQIVPLWNWNSVDTVLFEHSATFKLYLYGIEILLALGAVSIFQVQIVPLWNWNRFQTKTESTVVSVQIVPLWNWNRLRLTTLSEPNWGSNCTFMELKYIMGLHGLKNKPFKLYLYGIEIREQRQMVIVISEFKLYLYGIEIFTECPYYG